MLSFIANIFGYLLNFLYNLLNNYGLAIIIFSTKNNEKNRKNAGRIEVFAI